MANAYDFGADDYSVAQLRPDAPARSPATSFGDEDQIIGAVPATSAPQKLPRNDFGTNFGQDDQVAQKPRAGLIETAGLVGGQLLDVVTHHAPAGLASALEGDEPFAERDWKDTLIERSRAKAQERSAAAGTGPTMIPGVGREDIAQLGPSFGQSVTPMVGGAATGVGTAAAATPLTTPAGGAAAGWAAGVGTAGTLAYRQATNQFVRDLRDSVNQDRASVGFPPINDAEFQQKATELAPLIREYGLWEAIPEAAGEALGLGIIAAPVKGAIGRLFGRNVLTRIASKTAALYGTELGTETVTQQGQHNVELTAGMKPGEQPREWTNPADIAASFKEVAPVTALQTTLMAGGVKGAHMLMNRGGVQPQPSVVPPGPAPLEGEVLPPGAPPPGAGPAPTGPIIEGEATPVLNTNLLTQGNSNDREGGPGIPGEVGGGQEPVQAGNVEGAGGEAAGAGGVFQEPETGPLADQARKGLNRTDLAALFDDPRSAAEIRADLEAKRRGREEAAQHAAGEEAVNAAAQVEGAQHGAELAESPPAQPDGTRAAPIHLETPQDVHVGAEQTAQPTPAQAEAGNYSKRHLKWRGLDISVETEAGQERTGIGPDGKPWSTTMAAPYGYIKGTTGRDGDHLDVYIGHQPQSAKVFVVDQIDPKTGKFDEHKIVLAVETEQDARAVYNSGFSDGSGSSRLGAITPMSVAQFKQWVKNGDTKKPLAWKPAPKPSETTEHPGLVIKSLEPGKVTHLQPQGTRPPVTPQIPNEPGTKYVLPSFATGHKPQAAPKKPESAKPAEPEAKPLESLSREKFIDNLMHDEETHGMTGDQYALTKTNRKDGPTWGVRIRKPGQIRGAILHLNAGPFELWSKDFAAARAAEEEGYETPPGQHVGKIGEAAPPAKTPEPKAPEAGPSDSQSKLKASAQADGFNTSVEYWHGTTHGRFTTFKESTLDNDVLGPAVYLSRGKGGAEFYGPGRGGDLLGPFWVRGNIVQPDTQVPWQIDEAGNVKKMAPAIHVLGWLKGQLAMGRRDAWGADMTPTAYTREYWKRRGVDGYDSGAGLEVAVYDPSNIRAGFTLESEAKPPPPKAAVKEPSDSKIYNDIALAKALAKDLAAGKPITTQFMQHKATEIYGGKLSEGKFDRKDMFDALELAVNMHIKEADLTHNPWGRSLKWLDLILSELPTQTVRSEEQVKFQQFSTPPTYAFAVAHAANVREGDTVLEPSAGTGSLVAAVSRPGVTIVANELSDRRAAMLRALVGNDGKVFTENAEQLNNVLPKDVKPTVVVMNPPFSQTAGRMGDKRDINVGANHIEQALKRLEPGGRLVAIVGRGMTMGAPRFRDWWARIGEANTVRANIGVEGSVYGKYGTHFGTRLLVIDNVAPTGEKPILTDAQTVDDLMRALEPVRNARPAAELVRSEPSSQPVAEGNQGARSERPARPEPRVLGPGERGERGVAEPGPARPGAAGARPAGVEASERHGVAPVQPERPGQAGAGGEPRPSDQGSRQPEVSGGERPGGNLQPPASGQPSATASGERIVVEQAAPGTQAASEISESLYESYEPQRVRINGAKKHPGPLVESAAMSSVSPPAPTYKPSIPRKVIDDGLLSLPQLEAVVYAGQAHERTLPAAEGATGKRAGYFIGDGTGVGKGREIAGIILDNWQQGRTKAVWVSEKRKLLNDAQRDWSGLGQDQNNIFNAGKVKTGEPIQAAKGIAFITYDTLKGGMSDQAALARGAFVRKQRVQVNGQGGEVAKVEKGRKNEPAQITVKLDNGSDIRVPATEVTAVGETNAKSRVDQLVEWFGKDYDGVIAFDEAHNMGNAAATKGDRGEKEAAQKALAGLQLQERLPNARVVYVSATGATEVSNLAYADRLGLWGKGTPFASRDQFVSEVEQGGIAAMELIARDMKQLGLYIARNLSYDGVEYSRLEHKLDANQREIYDTVAEAWQGVLRNINAALKLTGGNKDAKAKSAAMSAFWGGHQRFFNQIITSLQMPSVIKAVEADLKAGRQAVLQLTNTNEAAQERAAAKAETAEDIEDLDITPRDQIIQLVENSFPTQQYEKYVDEDGKERTRPVLDSAGNPVQNADAVRMREELVDKLGSIKVPQGPLDMVLDHFGIDTVAEVTGRKRRFVMKADEKTGAMRRVEDSRPMSANQAEIDTFQAGKKKVLVFSEAGGTGASYHADNRSASKGSRRAHYLVQAGWRADKAVQGFGRTHRTNQASAPIFHLVTTDLDGQKRFISSIARRLGQLGALTKGERKAGDQGVFSARDNLESIEATTALKQFYHALSAGSIEDVSIDEFERQTGLELRQRTSDGAVLGMKQELPPITTFLNRLLSLKIGLQNRVFAAFSENLDAVIEARTQAGLLDAGLETVRADKITKDSEKTVHTAPDSAAETKYVKLTIANKFVPTKFESVANNRNRKVSEWVKSPNGKVYAVTEAPSRTQADTGVIVPQFRLIGPSSTRLIEQHHLQDRNASGEFGKSWSRIDKAKAETLWQDEIDKAPEFITRDMHLITGAILPIWDRLKGDPRVVRLQTDQGERLLGRVVPESRINETLKALGAETQGKKVDPATLFTRLMSGAQAKLANGWTLKRSLVAGEQRIELKGPSSPSEGAQVKADGAFSERIAYETRYFIPAEEEAGRKALAAITEHRPVVETSGGRAEAQYSLSQGGLTPAAQQRRADIERMLGQLVSHLVGKNVAVQFPNTIPIGNANLEAWGSMGSGVQTAAGVYNPATALIELAMADPAYQGVPLSTAFHESFHAVEDLLLNAPEFALMKRETPRLRKWLNEHVEIMRDAKHGWADDLADTEVRAIAFEMYATRRFQDKPMDGFHTGIARLFNRLLLLLKRVRNKLSGLGFKTAEDIFGQVYRGEMAGRDSVRGPNAAPEPLPGPERIVGAAIIAADGRVFVAGNHILAIDEARTANADYMHVFEGREGREPVGGFFTSKGRYVSREEAAVISGAEVPKGTGVVAEGILPRETRASDREFVQGWQGRRLPNAREYMAGRWKDRSNPQHSIGRPRMRGDGEVNIPAETIAAQLEARNLPKLAGLASAARVGKFNTTEARTQVQDKFIRWKHIQDAVEEATGEKLPEAMNVYMAESLYYGRTGQRLEELEKNYIDPLVAEIKKQGLTVGEVNQYLIAKHAPERNANIRKINPDIENPSGMSDEEAQKIFDDIDNDGKRDAYEAVEKKFRALIDETRVALVAGGLISQNTLDAWENAYQHYAPLRGFAEDSETEDTHGHYGKGYDVRGPESKRALGRTSLADGPLAYAMLQAQQAIVRAEKAQVGRTAMRFVNANPMPGLWKIDKGDIKRVIDPNTGLVTEMVDPLWRTRDNVFALKINGETYFINFEGEYGANLARALKNLGTANLHPALRMISTFTRLQARLATSWNPDFMIPNLVRDMGEAFISMQEQDQKAFTKQFVKHLRGVMGGTFLALTGKDGGKYAQAFREFDEAGGRIRFFGMEDVEDIKKTVASKMRRLEGGAVNNMIAAGEKALQAIEIVNATIENATRLAVYMAARDVGMSKAKAASTAREITVNFNRKGELGAAVSALYMFANASMQGSTRMLGAMKSSKWVRRAAYGVAAMGASLALYNLASGGDDDDGTPYYLKLPSWERDTNMILMWPKGMGHDGQYVKIPLPYGYSFFHTIGARMIAMSFGKEKPAKAVGAMASSVLDAFDPLGKDENMLAQFAPTLARPAIHLATNKNWTGRPINPEPMPWNRNEPDASRYFRSASPFAIAAADQINRATGGTKHESGLVDWSPGTIDYMLGFITGGLGRFALNVNTTALGLYNGTEWQVDKTPIVRRFYGIKSDAADRQLYFEERDKVMAAHARRTAYSKDDDQKNLDKLGRESRPELDVYGQFVGADRQRTQIRKDIDEIKANDKFAPREKERRVKLKEREELDLMLGARRALQDQQRAPAIPQ